MSSSVKVVYNSDYGGFSLSHAGMFRYAELAGIELWREKNDFGHYSYWKLPPAQRTKENPGHLSDHSFNRTDPFLVQVVEELGDAACGHCASLRIAKVPKGSRYRIDEYDGSERVMTPEDYDWEVA